MFRKVLGASIVTLALTASSFGAFSANLGPSHSTFSGTGGGSFGVALSGAAPSLLFGPGLGESWTNNSQGGTARDNAAGSGGSSAFTGAGRTFCVEGVTFSPQTTYTATVDATVLYGSSGQLTALTAATRTVFANYVLNTAAFVTAMSGQGLGTLAGGWNKIMQALFWDQQLVDQSGTLGSTFYDQLTAGQQSAYNALLALAATGQEANVMVLNLWSGGEYASDKQSHLTMIIPAPGAALLGMLGLGMVGWVRRRVAG